MNFLKKYKWQVVLSLTLLCLIFVFAWREYDLGDNLPDNLSGNVIDAVDADASSQENTEPEVAPSQEEKEVITEVLPSPAQTQDDGPPATFVIETQTTETIQTQTSQTPPPPTPVPEPQSPFLPWPSPENLPGGGGPAPDTTVPVITVTGSNPITVAHGGSYTDAGATATDNVDSSVTVQTTGSVNTNTVGAYTITYNATDAAGNAATAKTRTVNVTDQTAPVITLQGVTPTYITKNSTYTDAGATATDGVDGSLTSSIVTVSTVNTSINGTYTVTYNVSDAAGNAATQVTRTVKVATYVYIPKFTFGSGNGDGNNWQAWRFSGSYVFDWADAYVNNYLHETFKFKNFAGGSSRLQKGIFTHNPQQGFETTDLTKSPLDNSPQQNGDNHYYSVDTQWDSTGYTYTITDTTTSTVYDTAHTNVSGIDQNMWVGWNSSSTDSDFQFFPSGTWLGTINESTGAENFTGGTLMMLTPYRVYVP